MFRKLLAPFDGSELAEQALAPASAIARASECEGDLVLVHEPPFFDGLDELPLPESKAAAPRAGFCVI